MSEAIVKGLLEPANRQILNIVLIALGVIVLLEVPVEVEAIDASAFTTMRDLIRHLEAKGILANGEQA